MVPSPGPESRSSGTEVRDTVAAVLQDQKERAERRDTRPEPPPDRGPLMAVLFVVLLAATLWVLLAPPAFLMPTPPAPPSPAEMEAGLRMDLWVAASSLEDYRAAQGRYPQSLLEAVDAPEKAADIEYSLRSGGAGYRLIGQRDSLVVVYESDEPLRTLSGPALPVVQGTSR